LTLEALTLEAMNGKIFVEESMFVLLAKRTLDPEEES